MAIRARVLTAVTAAALVVGGPAAQASAAVGWRAGYSDGLATVSPDRSEVRICDGRADDRVYKAVWMNDNKLDARGPFEVRAPQGGCKTDSSILGDVWVFKICWGHLGPSRRVVWDKCGTPVWVQPKPDHMQ
ncbi:hypothetical protein [Nonomuraea sp. NPDC002799]